MPKKKTPAFETALSELEALVGELENGDLNLADSLQKFERGVTLARQCQQSLIQAEQKIRTLSDANGDNAQEAKYVD